MGIDPYYLTYRAEQFGYHSQIIIAGRRINDDMGKYIAEQTVKQLIPADKSFSFVDIDVLGMLEADGFRGVEDLTIQHGSRDVVVDVKGIRSRN